MTISFPASLDSLSNPAASDPRTGHAAQHADVNDAIEAIEGVIGTTASPVLARLGGVAGGQTLIGGSAASETLTLRSTSHATKGKVLLGTLSAYDELADRLGVGTASPSAKLHGIATTEQLRLGYDVANYLSATVGSTGEATLAATGGTITLQGTAATDGPTLGAELLGTAGWTVPGGWTESPDDVFTHANGGGTSALSHSASISSATKYQLSWTISGRTTGSVVFAFGGQSSAATIASGSFGPTTTSTAGLTITPTNDFDGALSVTSLKLITGTSSPVLRAKSSGAVTAIECRAPTVGTNIGYGVSALRYVTTGSANTAIGGSALQSLTTGSNNCALGTNALSADTVGFNNTAVGMFAMNAMLSGSSNCGIGVSALQNNTAGTNSTAIGVNALLNYTGSGGAVAIGQNCARYIADGSTAFTGTGTSNGIYIGTGTKAFDNNADTGAIVIGNAATGLGANTTAIGTTSTTAATIYGAGTHSLTDATTNAAVTVESLIKNVTGAGVGSSGLGPRLVFGAESSTTVDTTQADITVTWTDATHATRKTRLALSAWDSAAAREGMRIEADGSVARLGFFGATAVVKPTALTASVSAAPAGGTGTAAGGWDTAGNRDLAIATLNNLKTRVDQLEAKLQALGLLT